MGLFSGKTIISVASSVYNLAGEEKDRPIFIQNLVLRNILSGSKRSLGETITMGYLQGPGIKFRNFFRWALDNYGLIGVPDGTMYAGDIISTDTVALYVPHDPGEIVWVQQARLGDSDYEMWAEQWIIRNYPDRLDDEWEADMDDVTKNIHIKFETGEEYDFIASDFESGAKYIFAYYTISTLMTEDAPIEGDPSPLAPGDGFPSTAGYTLVSDDTTSRTETLTKTVDVTRTYSDGRPDENSSTVTTTSPTVNRRVQVYEKVTYEGNDPDDDAKISLRDIRNLVEDEAVVAEVDTDVVVDTVDGGTVTRTTTTVTTEEVLEEANYYQDDTQKIYNIRWKPLDMWIYKIGSGITELDDLVIVVGDYGKFYPAIPIRIDNEFISDKAGWEDQYTLAKRAFRKGTDGAKYDKIVDDISTSEDLGDMDYIYVVYGVSLNVIDKSCRRYIYEFMLRLKENQVGDAGSAEEFEEQLEAYKEAYDEWLEWRNTHTGGGGGGGGGYSDPPPLPQKPTLPTNEIKIQQLGTGGEGTNINYDIRISWNFISETDNQDGIGKTGAKKGDLWLEDRGTTTLVDPTYVGQGGDNPRPTSDNIFSYDTIRIWWQYEADKYRYIDIAGLVHKNFIYGGKNVTITAKAALADGEESGFIIPMHYATYRSMRLVDSTQMGTACVFLVFNVYEVRKQKWYESWFFKILFVVVVAIVSVVFTGGAGFGLLGAHTAVGASFGLTGMTAAIVGSIANALSALVLSTILSKLVEGLGPLGSILSALVGIIVSGGLASIVNGGSFQFNFAELMKAENILKLINAAGDGYAAYVRSSITSMQNDLVQIQEEANAELRRVRETFFEEFGFGGGQIDPMMFVGSKSPVIAESRDTFLTRTLMTGSDVAQMSIDMLNDYVELTTTLPDAFT